MKDNIFTHRIEEHCLGLHTLSLLIPIAVSGDYGFEMSYEAKSKLLTVEIKEKLRQYLLDTGLLAEFNAMAGKG